MRPISAKSRKPVTFEFPADQGHTVHVAGTFNKWNPTVHPLYLYPEDGVFRTVLRLPEGTHEYKFVVDGIWQADVNCPHWIVNELGTLNSVVHV